MKLKLYPALAAAVLCFAALGLAVSCGQGESAPRADGAAAAPQSPAFALVAAVDGAAVLAETGATLAIGDKVAAGQTVATGPDGSVELSVDGMARILVKPGTRFRLDRLDAAGRRLQATDLAGTIMAKVEKLASGESLIVRTPATACGVRGTVFLVSVDAAGSRYAVREGRVALFPAAALDRGWIVSSTGGGNRLDLDRFPQVAAGQSLAAPAADPALADLDRLLAASSTAADDPALSAALPWIKAPASAIGGDDAAAIDAWLKPAAETAAPPLPAAGAQTAPPKSAAAKAPIPKPPVAPKPTGPAALPIGDGASLTMEERQPVLNPANSDLPWNFDAPVEAVAVDAKPALRLGEWDVELGQYRGAQAALKVAGDSAALTVVRPNVAGSDPVKTLPDVSLNVKGRKNVYKGMVYELSYTVWADLPAPFVAVVHEDNRDLNRDGFNFTDYKPWIVQTAATAPTRYRSVFANLVGDDAMALLLFQLGKVATTYHLQDISLRPIGRMPAGDGASLIPNGDFSRGFLAWQVGDWAGSKAACKIEGGAFTYLPGRAGIDDWLVQLISQAAVELKAGSRYALDFDARAGGADKIGFLFQENNRDVNKDGNSLSVEAPYVEAPLGTAWRHFHAEFSPRFGDNAARAFFNLGQARHKVQIANVALKRMQ